MQLLFINPFVVKKNRKSQQLNELGQINKNYYHSESKMLQEMLLIKKVAKFCGGDILVVHVHTCLSEAAVNVDLVCKPVYDIQIRMEDYCKQAEKINKLKIKLSIYLI